ncbi:MAG: hypothetical protein GYA24_12300 [Candidatus Lokiarchaeota archaeon]|nr:hypothetical protein [Candidatus Lokiarchaeota archaeon]
MKLKTKIKKSLKTAYWNKQIMEICKAQNITVKQLLSRIKSTQDFIRLIPTTNRSTLDAFGKEMLVKPSAKHFEAHTSGTSTSNPITVYFSLLDVARMATSLVRNYEHMGVGQGGRLIGLMPQGSSISQGDGKIEIIMPHVKFIYFEKLTEAYVKEILAADSLYSYANIPIQMLTRYKPVVDECRKEGKINLRTILATGDFLPESSAVKLKEILGEHVRIYNPYNSIESLMSSYCCEKGTIHISSGYYFPEIADDNHELLMTPLCCESMHYFRYRSGDIVEKVNCTCNNPDLAIKLIGRANATELHKNLRVDTIQNIVFSSDPFKTGKIDGESGIISTKLTSEGRMVDIYLKQGKNFVSGEENMIIKQLEETVSNSNEFAFKLLSTSTLKNWLVNFHVMEALPSKVFPGKWKLQVN